VVKKNSNHYYIPSFN